MNMAIMRKIIDWKADDINSTIVIGNHLVNRESSTLGT